MSLKKWSRVLSAKDYDIFSLLGFVFIVVCMTFYQLAIEIGTASVVATLFSFNPIFNTIFSYFILVERLSKKYCCSSSFSFRSINHYLSIYRSTYVGVILALTSAAILELYSTLSRRISQKYNLDVLTITCYSFLFGAFELAILILTSHMDSVSAFFKRYSYLNKFADFPFITGISLNNLPLLLYLRIIVTAGGFALYFICLKEAGAFLASIIFFAKPAVAAMFA